MTVKRKLNPARRTRRKAAHAANCGIAAVGSYGMAGLALYLFAFCPLAEVQVRAEAAKPPVNGRTLVSKPVVLYRKDDKASRSERAVRLLAAANSDNWVGVIQAGRESGL